MTKHFQKYVLFSWIPLCILAGMISIIHGQDDCGDLRNYHYYNAFSFFHQSRSSDIDVPGLQGFLNPILDFPFYFLTVIFPRSPRMVAFFMGLPFGLMAYFSLMTGLRLFSGRPYTAFAAIIAAIFGLSGTAAFSQIGLSTNEIPTAAFVVAGLCSLLKAIESRAVGFSPYALLAGFLVGVAVGGKLTASPYAIALAAATIAGFEIRKLPITMLAIGISGIFGVLVTGGFWMVHLYFAYKNPIFPYHNDIFHSNWAAPNAYVDPRFFPNPGLQTIFYPFWWMQLNGGLVTESEYPFQDSRIASIFIVCGLSALMFVFRFRSEKTRIPAIWRAVIAFWVTAYVLWLQAFSIYRYAVPIEITGAFLYVGGIAYLFREERAFATAISAVGLCILAVFTTYPNWGHIPFQTRSFPVVRPIIPDHALVIASDYYPMAYVAALGGPSVRFIDGRFNFLVPPSSPLDNLVTKTIANWRGPVDVLGPRAGGQSALDILDSNYNIVTTKNCEIVRSGWDNDALQLCQAYRNQEGKNFQPALALSFKALGNGFNFLRSGWSTPEPWGIWSLGSNATISVPVNPFNKSPLLLTATCKTITTGALTRSVEVYADARLIATWSLTTKSEAYQAEIDAPTNEEKMLVIRFHLIGPVLPVHIPLSAETRNLGIGIETMMLQETLG